MSGQHNSINKKLILSDLNREENIVFLLYFTKMVLNKAMLCVSAHNSVLLLKEFTFFECLESVIH